MSGVPAAVGFVPSAPLLVPQVAGGSASQDEELREACRTVARRLAAHTIGEVVVIADTSVSGEWDDSATWGFEGFGVARRPGDDRPRLPWPLGVGAWLLDEIGWAGRRRFVSADRPASVTGGDAVLVVGDGSARRTEKAPGHFDDRAEQYDATIATAIATGDHAALGALDVGLSAALMCAGAPAWRALAALVGQATVQRAELLSDSAPYGVAYFAGYWLLAGGEPE